MRVLFKLGILMTIAFGFLCFLSCGYQSPRYVKLAHEITAKTAKKLKEEKKLCLVGTGGKMMHDIQAMDMSFNYYKVVDIQTARQLLVDSVEEYLSAINSNEKVRPYLHEYPFTAKNVEIVIYFRNPDGSKVASGKINIAAVTQGEVVYYIDYPEKHDLRAIHEEAYEEAFNLMKNKAG